MTLHPSRLRRAALAATVCAAVAPVVLATTASAATHHGSSARVVTKAAPAAARRALTLTFGPYWRFQVGAQVPQQNKISSAPNTWFHADTPVLATWSASRPVDHYDLAAHAVNSSDPTLYPLLTDSQDTSYPARVLDALSVPGGGSLKTPKSYRLTAVTSSGRTAQVDRTMAANVHFEQQDGTTYGNQDKDLFSGPPGATSVWEPVQGDELDGGTALRSSHVLGAAVTFPVTAAHDGQVFAPELTAGPDQGAVDVLVDGVTVGRVSLAAAQARPRTLVAQFPLTAGTHRITLLTASSATVTVDGLFLSD